MPPANGKIKNALKSMNIAPKAAQLGWMKMLIKSVRITLKRLSPMIGSRFPTALASFTYVSIWDWLKTAAFT